MNQQIKYFKNKTLLRTMYSLPNTTASENLLKSVIKRREEVPTGFYGTGTMIDRTLTTANFEMRHSLTRLAVHGFHHVTIGLMQMYTM